MSSRSRLNFRRSESGRLVTPEAGTARGKIRKRLVYHTSLRVFGVVRISLGLPQVLLHFLRSFALVAGWWLIGLVLKRIAGVTPRIESAAKRANICPTGVEKRLRRTGARMLVGSGAVRDNETIARDVGQMPRHII